MPLDHGTKCQLYKYACFQGLIPQEEDAKRGFPESSPAAADQWVKKTKKWDSRAYKGQHFPVSSPVSPVTTNLAKEELVSS